MERIAIAVVHATFRQRFAERAQFVAGREKRDPQATPDRHLTHPQRRQQPDVVITSGGVSVGAADYTKQLAASLGQCAFWSLTMRPGRPLAFGSIESGGRRALLFGLPGNPVAVMVSFYFFARQALLRLMGEHAADLPLVRVRAAQAIAKRPGRTEYQRGIVSPDGDGQLQVALTGAQGSGILSSMAAANCIVVLHEEQAAVRVGDMVEVLLFDGLV